MDTQHRFGWAAFALVGLALGGCAGATRAEPVSTTSTTAGGYMPGGVELYMARRDAPGQCPSDLSPNIEFPQRSVELVPAEGAYLDKWAACLNHPALSQATVVLVGGDDPAGVQGLFVRRAQRVKEALIARGVDGGRIVIGASNAARAGGAYASASAVRVEITHTNVVRSFPNQDPAVRYGLR